MTRKKESPRQKLGKAANRGDLRYWLESKLDEATLQLLIDVVIRYCEPRRKAK